MEDTARLFQIKVGELLVRNKSILDILTKFQTTNARVNRSVVKAVTSCGCIKVDGKKCAANFTMRREDRQIDGQMCDDCTQAISREIGENLFYLASLCNALDLDIQNILEQEVSRVSALGKYNLR